MSSTHGLDELWVGRILESVSDLSYGTVLITVHDGRIVQIERSERRRFDMQENELTKPAGGKTQRVK
ncbi:YezD family protein [Paenibacillus sp. y28]|uniref:YezD family protein n=1 Tax=Paenibacillus sp. y28 TaxID=3129110 RepID=UPI00301B4A8B